MFSARLENLEVHNAMKEIFDAIIQGIIQGATEFLPVSSSGHLSLTQHFLGIEEPGLLFDVLLHLGTLAAVCLVYYKLLFRLIKSFFGMVKKIFTGKFHWSQMDADENLVAMLIIGLIPLFLMFCPVPGTGMKVKDYADLWATDASILIEGLALIATSVLLFIAMRKSRSMLERVELKARGQGESHPARPAGRRRFNPIDALCVGFAQCVAGVFPGLSRSGSTLSVGLMRGINRQTALDYSFVLGIPAILAASLVSAKDAAEAGVEINAVPMVVGVITAAAVGFLAIKLLRWMVSSNKLLPFVIYTAVLGVIVVVIALVEQNTGAYIGIKAAAGV